VISELPERERKRTKLCTKKAKQGCCEIQRNEEMNYESLKTFFALPRRKTIFGKKRVYETRGGYPRTQKMKSEEEQN
jgi:hypothetical protein